MEITTAARRLTLQHNNLDDIHSGDIHMVNLKTGDIDQYVGTYAAKQIEEGDEWYGEYALLRIGYGRLTQKDAQAFINAKGQGW